MALIKRTLPQIIFSAVAVWMILEYFLTPSWFVSVGTLLRNFSVIISAFALGLGAIATISYHVSQISKRVEGRWMYSIVLLAALGTMTVTGLMGFMDQPIFAWLWNNITVPAQQTVYSLLMFYVAIAAYRALRVRNSEAFVFMICAFIMMMANAPVTQAWFPIVGDIGSWIFRVPNTGSARGYTIAATIGMITLYIRSILGRERRLIGAEEG